MFPSIALFGTLALLATTNAMVIRSTSDFNLSMSTVNQVTKGSAWGLEIRGPSHSFFKYFATLTHPNGTAERFLYETDFELGNSLTDNPTLPTNRTCMARVDTTLTVTANNKTLTETGTYQVTLDAVYYYGANGYEYDNVLGGSVCLSPPFTAESHTSRPIAITVTEASPSNGFSLVLPSPTPVQFDADFTGTPFQVGLLSTASSAPSTSSTSLPGGAVGRLGGSDGRLFWIGSCVLAVVSGLMVLS